ncbi:MAG: VanZ family protein [Oscillospiraceae bacterium]|nr:VanZ family protein [Oscillospiraceae bacterium]
MVYITGYLYFTFLTREAQPDSIISLVLFRKLRSAVTVEMGVPVFLRELFSGGGFNGITVEWKRFGTEPMLNMLLFIPMGYFLRELFHFFRDHVWRTVAAGFTISLLTETMQLVTHRGWYDVDDLINNTIGALIGAAVWKLFVSRKTEIWSQKNKS